ncbi:hypothetical protein KI387_024373, partial [Taxus chinensis]
MFCRFATQEISHSTDEEKCKDLTNLQEKSDNEMDQKASVDFLRSNATHEFPQRQEIKSEIEAGVESDHRDGSIIDNFKNGYPETPPLEEAKYEVPQNKEFKHCACTEMTTEAGLGGSDVEKPEYADGGKLLKLLKGNMDTGKPLGSLDHHISFDAYVENIKVVMENDVEQVREEVFGKFKQTDSTILIDSEVDLEDLSHCIQAGQERSTVHRWMECINFLSPDIPTGVFRLPIEDVSSTDKEKFQDITNLQEPSMKAEYEEISGALDASLCLSRLQISCADSVHSKVTHEFQGHEIKSEIEELAAESDYLNARNGSITDDINNGHPKLLTLEEAEYDVPKTTNLTTIYPEMKAEAGPDGLDAKKLESADSSQLFKELDATNTESAIPLSPLDASVDDPSVAIENDVVEDFGKAKQGGGAILADSDVGLEELSECIQAGQERTTLERWMECINSLSPHTPMDVLPLLTDETSCSEEEKCEDFTNWQEQSKNLTTVYPEMKAEAGPDGLDAKNVESADSSRHLKGLDATNMESGIRLRPLDGYVDDSSVAMGNDVVEFYSKGNQVGSAILVASVVGLEELSECIQAGQERTTVGRWMECINSLSPHTPVDVLPLSTHETSCTEEKNCEDCTNWLEQSKEKMDQEASGAVEGSVNFIHSKVDHAFHKLEIKSEIEECVESDSLKGSTDNIKNGSLELYPLEKVKYEVPKMKNSIAAYPEMTTDAWHGGLDIEEPESAGSSKILKLLKGYDILGCLLRNAKLVTLVISAILFVPWGLSKMAYKNLRMILLILTEAKQKSVAKIIKVLGSREIETSSVSPNGQETGESIVDSPNDHLLGPLGCYIGMAVASVLPEVIAINHQNESISVDELARLMGLAVNESLFQVLGTGSKQFADDFEESFRSTFNIKELVKQAVHDNIRRSCDSQGKWNSSLEGWIAGSTVDKSAEDICVHNRKIKISSSAELQRPNTRVKFQVQSDERSHKQETSGSPTSCNHARKVGADDKLSHLQHEFGNQSNFSNFDRQLSIKFSEAARNCRQKISEANCQVAGNDGAVSEGAIVGNLQQKNLYDFNSEVNVPHGINCSPHLKNDSGEIERNSLIVKDGVQAEKYPNNFVENSSFVSTERATATTERKGQNNDCNPSEEIQGNEEISWMQKTTQNVVLHAHAQCEGQSERQLKQFSSSINESDALALLLDNKKLLDPQSQQNFPSTLNMSVRELEKSNHFKSLELMQKLRNLEVQEEQFHVSSQSKNLARQSLELSHSKALFKKNVCIEEKLNKSYIDLSRACADELVAGMFVMLLALAYGAWRHSHALLSEAIALCLVSHK